MAYGREKNIGKRFGNLTVLEFVECGNGYSIYKCRCDCGTIKNFYLSNLRQGKTTSCGCLSRKLLSDRSKIHGDRHTRLYGIWTNIKTRCHNQNTDSYRYYGAKGIDICDEWNENYTTFKEWAVNNGYKENLTIDRIDNSKGYYPQNCRWVDDKTQSRNRDYAWYITIDGVTKHAKDWCKEYGINYKTAHTRKSRGWSDEDAATTPLTRKKTKGRD